MFIQSRLKCAESSSRSKWQTQFKPKCFWRSKVAGDIRLNCSGQTWRKRSSRSPPAATSVVCTSAVALQFSQLEQQKDILNCSGQTWRKMELQIKPKPWWEKISLLSHPCPGGEIFSSFSPLSQTGEGAPDWIKILGDFKLSGRIQIGSRIMRWTSP